LRPSVATSTVTGVPAAVLRRMVAPQPSVSSSGCGAITNALRVALTAVTSRPTDRSPARAIPRSFSSAATPHSFVWRVGAGTADHNDAALYWPIVLAGRVRGLVERSRLAKDLAWRQLPRFAVRADVDTPPTAYYLAPHLPRPSGGVRVIYRHVDALAAAGIPAAVVHDKAGFRCTWFANTTRVLAAEDVVLGPADVLVVPECYGPGLAGLPDGVRVVIFNQGAYHTFDLIPLEGTDAGAPYRGARGLQGLLAVSEDSAALLRYAFPELPVAVCRQVIDGEVFHPGAQPPGRRISFTTSRRPEERHQLLHLLRSRGALTGWTLTPIAGYTEAETARIMRESAVFLSFSERDGFGLPPAEAMASGCYVVGYPGGGGRDFFDPAYCHPVDDGDLLGFARAVEQACAAQQADPTSFTGRGRAASKSILDRYQASALREDVVAFFTPLLAARP
jgi:hypothetical protein